MAKITTEIEIPLRVINKKGFSYVIDESTDKPIHLFLNNGSDISLKDMSIRIEGQYIIID